MGFSTKQVTQVHLKKAHGYNEDNMPHVERTIPYTFDAYSAGNIKDTSRGKSSLDVSRVLLFFLVSFIILAH